MVKHGRGTREESEDRANTLVDTFEGFTKSVIIIIGVIYLLDIVGVNVRALLGGAAILGLAVAFGAQNLMRDYFTGFMILIEGQYKLNDLVTIGDLTGRVERITLRMTMLRDLSGNAHFISNGEIKNITNQTHEWSRAVIEVNVSYKEDVDRVIDILMEVANEVNKDPTFSFYTIDQPEMLGVDAFAESSMVIKFFIKTLPNQKWAVRRELLRRIKIRFDKEGIEMPLPHRVMIQRKEKSINNNEKSNQ